MPSFRLSVLGFAVCFPSPFPASLPQLFHRCLPSAFFRPLSVFSSSGPLSFVRFPSVSGYSAFCFFLSVLFTALPHSGFSVAPLLLSLLRFSLSVPPGFPCFPFSSRTWLSVGFLSSFPVSLPQLFHWCSPFSFPPAFVLCFAFFRPLCFRLLTTQLSALSFPFFPFSPGSGSFGAYLYPLPLCLLPYSGSALVLSFLFFVSPVSVFASQWLLFRSFALSFDFSVSP